MYIILFVFLSLFLCFVHLQTEQGEVVYPVYVRVRNNDYDPYLILFALPLLAPMLLTLFGDVYEGIELIAGQVMKGVDGLTGGGGGYEMRVVVVIWLVCLYSVRVVISQNLNVSNEVVYPVYIRVRNNDYDPYFVIFALPLIAPYIIKLCEAAVTIMGGMMRNGGGNGNGAPVPT